LPKIPTTILYLQPPEMMVTNPKSTRTDELAYNPAVYEILKQARMQLLANDALLFGK
jgi:alpha-amylase/alpha-mannosidase (GH57 family)